MIPIKLTVQAFGPYKGKETIDFRKFFDNRLFLITGNTGSGKTMIFDAICYALFGDVSGQYREIDTHQCLVNIHTSIHLFVSPIILLTIFLRRSHDYDMH